MKQTLAIVAVIMGILTFYWRSTPDLAFAILAVFMVVWGIINLKA